MTSGSAIAILNLFLPKALSHLETVFKTKSWVISVYRYKNIKLNYIQLSNLTTSMDLNTGANLFIASLPVKLGPKTQPLLA